MIIRELKIKNFRSYYGNNNNFEFSKGLTLILGDNGDGKTTLFEALQWLLDTTKDSYGSMDDISEMRKSKLEIGEKDEVSVYMTFDHDGEKSVEKSFTFERIDEKVYTTGKISYRGYETNGAEREMVSGKQLINICYDAFIQRFSMFKGESDLDVLKSDTALNELVDKFSDIKKFDDLVKYSDSFASKSSVAYEKEVRSNNKVSDKANNLSFQIRELSDKITLKKNEIDEKKSSISFYSSRLDDLEKNQENSTKYRELEDRRKTQEEKRHKLLGHIGAVNYNHCLLDDYWILCAFSDILNEFKKKSSDLSREKRKQERDFDRQQAEEIGKLNTIKEIQGSLINGSTELPWYLPDQETMEEMLQDHICKVCGRPIEEHSDAWNFMVDKLEKYRKHVEQKILAEEAKQKIENETLFKNDHIEELHNLAISLSGHNESFVAGLAQEIYDRQELVERFRNDLKKVEANLQDLADEKARLLIQAGNVSEAALEKDFDDIKGLFEQRNKAEVRLATLEHERDQLIKIQRELKLEFDNLAPDTGQIKVYKAVKNTLEAIAAAFLQAKKENLRRFLADMEDRANNYLAILSAEDFHGVVHLVQQADDSTAIKLESSNGTEIKNPSGSQQTVMYISILFAISDFTQEKRDEDYPLIFDAATSSFGDLKEDNFYNVINGIQKQCIIVTKDFLTKGKVRMDDIKKLDCPVYRIKKAAGFDQDNLATIRTTVEKIKD